MSATKILWGQILTVFLIVLMTTWGATYGLPTVSVSNLSSGSHGSTCSRWPRASHCRPWWTGLASRCTAPTSRAALTRPRASCSAWALPTPPLRPFCVPTMPCARTCWAGPLHVGRGHGRPPPGAPSTARWAQDDSDRFQRLVVERQTAALPRASNRHRSLWAVGWPAASFAARCLPPPTRPASPMPAVQLAEVFSGDIDLRRALRKEDRFSVVYETLEADGEPLRSGRVLSAEFQNGEKTYNAPGLAASLFL